jgi:hypothetical protein
LLNERHCPHSRPYTFVVLAILILIFGGRAALSTPTDILPNIAQASALPDEKQTPQFTQADYAAR